MATFIEQEIEALEKSIGHLEKQAEGVKTSLAQKRLRLEQLRLIAKPVPPEVFAPTKPAVKPLPKFFP